MEVGVQQVIHIGMHIAVGLHQVGERGIARLVVHFRARDLFIEADIIAAGQTPELLTQGVLDRDDTRHQQVGDQQGTGIDEGIARDAVLDLQLHDRIERLTGRLTADTRPDLVALKTLHRQYQRMHLGDRLDREAGMRAAGVLDTAIHMADGDAELVRVDLCQDRNVVRDLALVEAAAGIIGQAFEQCLESIGVEWRRHGNLEAAVEEMARNWPGHRDNGAIGHQVESGARGRQGILADMTAAGALDAAGRACHQVGSIA